MNKPLQWVRKGSCIICTSHALINTGYAVLRRGGKLHLIHRLVCARRYGKFKGGALHSCDTPACINPDHLSPGNQSENMQQAVRRNRLNVKKGEDNIRAVLTNEIAWQIYLATGSHREIANRFKTDHRTVGRIKRREAWACIHDSL